MDPKTFLEEYLVTDIEKDPLPIKVLRNAITKEEIPGQAVHWGFDYLDQRLCPLPLINHILEKLYQEVHQTDFSHCVETTLDGGDNGEQELRYEPLKLMRAIVQKLDEICVKEKEDFHDSVDGTIDSPDMLPHVYAVSYNNIKNSRRFMEDRMTVLPRMDRLFKLPAPVSYFAVFDGHNGSEAAAYGAAQLHQYLIQSLNQHHDVIPSISDAFESLDEVFIEKCRSGKVKSGSTVVLSLIMSEKLYVAWLGDSQAVLVKTNEINNLVTPHKPERKDELDRIRSLGGEVIQMHDTYRVNGNLAVSRAIGDADQKKFIISTPDIKMLELDGTEEFLVLGCDGLWDEISSETAAQIVRRQVVAEPTNISAISHELIKQAKKNGSHDNISVIVVFLEPLESIKNRYESVLEPEEDTGVNTTKISPEPVDAIPMEKFIEHGVDTGFPVLSEMNGHAKEGEQLVDFLSFGSSKESSAQVINDDTGNQSGDEEIAKKEVEEELSDAESDDEWQFEKPCNQGLNVNEEIVWTEQEQKSAEPLNNFEQEPFTHNLVDVTSPPSTNNLEEKTGFLADINEAKLDVNSPIGIPDATSEDEERRPESIQSKESIVVLSPEKNESELVSPIESHEFLVTGNTNPFVIEPLEAARNSPLIPEADLQQNKEQDVNFEQAANNEEVLLTEGQQVLTSTEVLEEQVPQLNVEVPINFEAREKFDVQSTVVNESAVHGDLSVDLMSEVAKPFESNPCFDTNWSVTNPEEPVIVETEQLLPAHSEQHTGNINLESCPIPCESSQFPVLPGQPVTLFEEFEENETHLVTEVAPVDLTEPTTAVASAMKVEGADQQNFDNNIESPVPAESTEYIEKFEQEPLIDNLIDTSSDSDLTRNMVPQIEPQMTNIEPKENVIELIADADEITDDGKHRPDSVQSQNEMDVLMPSNKNELASPVESQELFTSGSTNPFVTDEQVTTVSSPPLIEEAVTEQKNMLVDLMSTEQVNSRVLVAGEQTLSAAEENTENKFATENPINNQVFPVAFDLTATSRNEDISGDVKSDEATSSFDNNWNVVPSSVETPPTLDSEKPQTSASDQEEEKTIAEIVVEQVAITETKQEQEEANEQDQIPITEKEPAAINDEIEKNLPKIIPELPQTLAISPIVDAPASSKVKPGNKPSAKSVKSPTKSDAPVTKGKPVMGSTVPQKGSPTKPESTKPIGGVAKTTVVQRAVPKAPTGAAPKPSATKAAAPVASKTTGVSRTVASTTRSAPAKTSATTNGTDAKSAAAKTALPPNRPRTALTIKPAVPKTTVPTPSTTSPKKTPVGASSTTRPTAAKSSSVTAKVSGDVSKPASNITRARPKPIGETTTAATKAGSGIDVKKPAPPKPATGAKPTAAAAPKPLVSRSLPTSARTAPPSKPATTATKPTARTVPRAVTESSKPAGTISSARTTTKTVTAPAPKAHKATKKVESNLIKPKKPSPSVPGKVDPTTKAVKSTSSTKATTNGNEKSELIEQNGVNSIEGNANMAELNATNGGVNGDHSGMNGETEKQDAVKENGVHLDDADHSEANFSAPPSASEPIENLLG